MTELSSLPILLNDVQHAKVKENLALVLKEQYSIVNQSSGKLDYMAAVIMGFTNHHQRKSLLVHNKDEFGNSAFSSQQCSDVPPRKPTWWPLSASGYLWPEQKKILKERGWIVWERSDDYQELEIQFNYGVSRARCDLSFNVRLSFSLLKYDIEVDIGDNLGHGFNHYLKLTHSDFRNVRLRDLVRERIQAFNQSGKFSNQARSFSENFADFPDVANALLNELEFIAKWLVIRSHDAE